MNTPEYDLVIFGASGFVGRLVCEYLAARAAREEPPLRWAMAGRSRERLEAVRDDLPGDNRNIPLIIADAEDDAALRHLCEQARVVISTVGPYALYGEPLVRACAETGTDYVDLTGEVLWIRRMMDRYEATARNNGARLVPCCGFDSIPSDLGAAYTQQAAQQQWGRPAERIHMRVKAIRGGLSGGTAASMLNVIREVRADRRRRRDLANPYLLCPPDHGFHRRQNEYRGAFFDTASSRWAAPFIMAGINTRVVHRSNALSENNRVADLAYDEAVLTGRGWRGRLAAWAMGLGLGAFALGAWFRPTRRLIQRFFLPASGEGPNRDQRENGFFDLRFHAFDAEGRCLATRVRGDRDPGYGATAGMLSEAGICLARDVGPDRPGGFWTPATLLGKPLVTRLERHAGLRFETLPAAADGGERSAR